MPIEIQAIPAFNDNYIWAIVQTEQKQVWLVDPGDAAPAFEFLAAKKLNLAGILITHHHFDHYNGTEALAEKFHIPVYGAAHEKNPGITHPVSDHDQISLFDEELQFKVLTIPGHTLEHIAYYSSKHHLLFCGDTLFAAGCGRVFEGTPEQMYQSLMRLKNLPEQTKIYCGHEYTLANLKFAQTVEPDNLAIAKRIQITQQLRENNLPSLPSLIELEKKTNPFLRCEFSDVIAAAQQRRETTLNNPVEIFATLRHWKNNS